MPAVPTESERGVERRGVGAAWATEPPSWGEPVTPLRLSRLEELERPKVFQFARPDGSRYETTWRSPWKAEAWASVVGHRLLGEVPSSAAAAPAPTPRATEDRGTEYPLSAPPLVQAEPPPPPKRVVHKIPPPPVPPPAPPPPAPALIPRRRRAPLPPPRPEEYGLWEYFEDGSFLRTTMTESMPLISKWFGLVGKGIQVVPGLKGVGKAYEAIGEIADGLSLIYELGVGVDQAEALEKGSKQLVKRVRPVKRVAEGLLKKKYPEVSEAARKKAAEILESLFEKYITDPAIEGGARTARERDAGKDLDRSLWDEFKRALDAAPAVGPTTSALP